MNAEIFEQVRGLLTHYNRTRVPIAPASRLVDDLDMDSLDLVEFAFDLESEFKVEFEDIEIGSSSTFGTVEKVVLLLESKLSNRQMGEMLPNITPN